MPKFSKRSQDKLNTCDQRLIRLFEEVVKDYDCTVIYGHRTKEEQDRAYQEKKSKLKYPQSKHNKYPSMAVDVAPWFPEMGIDWEDYGAFYMFAGYVMKTAKDMGISIRNGGDWDSDHQTKDQRFNDLVHFELTD